MMKSSIFLLFFVGLGWAADTDAEIMKDLDFFINMDVVHEEGVSGLVPELDDVSSPAKKESSL